MNKITLDQNNIVSDIKESFENRADIYSILDFLKMEDLQIPEYQRPYKWQERNVTQLLDDILTFSQKEGKYRIGTIVVHQHKLKDELGKEKVIKDIVDGQQRYTTLRLLVYALADKVEDNETFEMSTQKLLSEVKQKLQRNKICYRHIDSINNIRNNYNLIKRSIQQFDDKVIQRLLEDFEVVMFFISDETEAFQFFDSQNSRGMDLNPHDLLKAFHLREFDIEDKQLQAETVREWEDYQSKDLARLFAHYLYRIIIWSENRRAFYFDKSKIDIFKGVNMENIETFPYIKMFQIAHYFVDDYNANLGRKIDKNKMEFPFQIDQLIIKGRRFFEYVNYYIGINERFRAHYVPEKKEGLSRAQKLVRLIYANNFIYRTGERYLKELFECVIIYFIDKFGDKLLDEFIERAFVWVYVLRFRYQRLGFVSIDNYVTENNLFVAIKKALKPKEAIKFKLEQLPEESNIKIFSEEDSKRMDPEIAHFFKENRYYADK